MNAYDFVIIGGGPAGATAGALLAQRGMRVAICEQKVFPRPKVCGEFMSSRIRPVLRQLGLETEFDRLAGPPICRVVAYPSGALTLRGRFPGGRGEAGGMYPRALARDRFDEMIVRRAGQLGAAVLQPCRVTGVTGSPGSGFQIATASEGILAARGVILAHGMAQRGDMDPAPAMRRGVLSAEFVCFKAHFTGCALDDDAIAIGSIPGLYAGLVRTSANGAAARYSLAFVLRRQRIEEIGNSGEAQFQDLLRHNAGFAKMLAGAARVSPWLASGPLRPGVREVYREGRFFVGNAAGEVHALVGEGIALALRGAELLAEEVAAHGMGALDAAGRSYECRWRREFALRYRAANVFAYAMMQPGLAGLLGRFVGAVPPLMNWCIRASGKGA